MAAKSGRGPGGPSSSSSASPGGLSDEVARALLASNERMARDVAYLRDRLDALETTSATTTTTPRTTNAAAQRQAPAPVQTAPAPSFARPALLAARSPSSAIRAGADAAARAAPDAAPEESCDGASDEAVADGRPLRGGGGGDDGLNGGGAGAQKVSWGGFEEIDAAPDDSAPADAADEPAPPPMEKIKFLDLSPTNDGGGGGGGAEGGDADAASDDDSTSTYDSEGGVAFSGWARCFFQARHHRAATQIVARAASATSQDTYLYLTIYPTKNELRISNADDPHEPPLVDPPIPLGYFYAARVPGSRTGAALFLKNDARRLRKYIFRFEFVNRSVHQPPARYLQFVRSGKAAKRSMRGLNKMVAAYNKMGEERRENLREDRKRAQDAFAAHLGTLDELLREPDESADRFVECVNARNEELEELARGRKDGGAGGTAAEGGGGSPRRRSRPPPPYWGSGFNRPSANDDGADDERVDSDSDYSEEEDELYYDDDDDDETLFDKVQVSTEQTLETLFNHIVK